MTAPRYSLGIDIGGTFTDIVVLEQVSGTQFSSKVLTTHENPATAVIRGLGELIGERSIKAKDIEKVVHATTLFTNALIERRGARTGLITTSGFRDVLEIGSERKYDLYDLSAANAPPLVPRHLRREVIERIGADGRVRVPLDEEGLRHEVEELVGDGVQSIAVAFLHAYANPAHEEWAAELVARYAPHVAVTTSCEVAREIREYDRISTAVANAYVKPLAATYLDAIATDLAALGVEAPLLLMLSNGGLTHIEEAKRVPIQMLESGPAAGALSAAHFAAADEVRDLLAFDMGGTTAKLSLIEGGEPMIAYGFEAGRQKRFVEGSGLPVQISTVELIEIGAGGCSIAHRDEIGLLKVGPESAGSEPGPAAYGRGGTSPTVTDANLILDYIDPASFAGGRVPIDLRAAEGAISGLARTIDLPIDEASFGIYDIVNENMTAAARVHIAERGRDPRNYTLLCTGGGGPLHGYQVARKLGLKCLICPPSAGVASAVGLIIAPARIDRVATVGVRLDSGSIVALEAAFQRLEAEAREKVRDIGVDTGKAVVQRLADGRFVGQGFNLVTALPSGPFDTTDEKAVRAALGDAFKASYREKFARTPPDVAIEFVSIRVSVTVSFEGDPLAGLSQAETSVIAEDRKRHIYLPEAGGRVQAKVYRRSELRVGDRLEGPALVEEDGSTLIIGPDGRAEISKSHNIIVTLP